MSNIIRILHSNVLTYSTSQRWRVFNNISLFQRKIKNENPFIRLFHHARRKPEVSRNTMLFSVKISLGLGAVISFKAICGTATVHCEGTRLVGVASELSDPEFNWSKFWILMKPHYLEFLGAVLAALVCAALNIQIPRVLGSIINILSKSLISQVPPVLDRLRGPVHQTILMYLSHSVFTFVYIYLLSNIGEGIAKTLKTQLFTSILKQDISFFDNTRTGELINRLTVDITDFKSSFKQIVSQGLRNGTQVVGCAISLYLISPQMTATMLVVVPTVIIAGTLLGAVLRTISYKAKAQSGKLTLIAEEAVSNIRTVRAFAMEELEAKLFEEEAELARQMNVKLGAGIAMFQAGTSLFLNGMVLSTIYLGGYLLSQDQITPGDLMAFLVAAQILQRSFAQISLLFGTYIKGKHAGARVFQMVDMEPTIPLNTGNTIPYHSLIPEVEFWDVKFAYPSRQERDVLKNFSLKIPVGKTVALVGASGSGKSTLGSLLERFYDVEEGDILIGGQPVSDLNPTWLRGRVIGLISQEPVLFATTVMENIRYGRPNATDAEVIEAAKLANAHQFITEFPQGYNTLVGERGAAVSGGQKQRIAIARALVKNPSILILDEATSALDSESEHLVQTALDTVTKFRTTIVIAHRLSTIKNADLIVVLHDGAIAEMGTHEVLMQKNGMYATLVRQQQLFSSS